MGLALLSCDSYGLGPLEGHVPYDGEPTRVLRLGWNLSRKIGGSIP